MIHEDCFEKPRQHTKCDLQKIQDEGTFIHYTKTIKAYTHKKTKHDVSLAR